LNHALPFSVGLPFSSGLTDLLAVENKKRRIEDVGCGEINPPPATRYDPQLSIAPWRGIPLRQTPTDFMCLLASVTRPGHRHPRFLSSRSPCHLSLLLQLSPHLSKLNIHLSPDPFSSHSFAAPRKTCVKANPFDKSFKFLMEVRESQPTHPMHGFGFHSLSLFPLP